MQTYLITAELRSPLIATGHMTLDALLAAALFDRMGDVDAAHAAVPVRQVEGLFHSSAAIVQNRAINDRGVAQGTAFVANLRAQHDLRPDQIALVRGGKLPRIGLGRRREYGAVLSAYPLLHTRSVQWIATCDIDQVTDLLGDLPFIGKKRAQGFGEVGAWDAELTDLDPLLDGEGHPRRPIPIDLFTGDRSLAISDAAWKPAYWNPAHRSACYAPLPLS